MLNKPKCIMVRSSAVHIEMLSGSSAQMLRHAAGAGAAVEISGGIAIKQMDEGVRDAFIFTSLG